MRQRREKKYVSFGYFFCISSIFYHMVSIQSTSLRYKRAQVSKFIIEEAE
jgi:hypothetical protein